VSDDLSIPNPGYRGNRAGRYGTGQSRIQGMDPDTRRLVLFAGGLGAVLVMLIGASALIGRHSGEVPIVIADSRPIRVKPDNPGGMKIDGAENDVFSGGSDTANSKLAAAAENPDTKALRTAAAPPPPVIDAPVPEAVTTPPPVVTKLAPVVGASVAKPVPPAGASVAKPVVASATPAKPAAVASVAAAKPAPGAIAKPQAAAADAHPSASGHQALVQLAALTSEDAARNEWQQLAKRMPELLNGKQPSFSRIERDGHTFWRVRTAGFADVAQARAFCEHVRAKGGGCSVADF
jgi:hypothetical protein